MIEIPGRIPLTIHPFFWLFAALIGYGFAHDFTGALIWLGIIFVSVLFHEYGHALTALLFKQKARIQLIALGGVTLYEGPSLKFWQQFLITLNGPLFGFLLYLLAAFLLRYSWNPLVVTVLENMRWANLFWTIVNLLPVLPLDGGQLLRILLEASFGVKGFRAALLIGALLAFCLAVYCFLIAQLLAGAFFFLFAYQGFDSWRKSRFATRTDRDEENKERMMQAEIALQEGQVEKARQILFEVHEKVKGGMLADAATQYLAFLDLKEGKRQEAYDLLLPIKAHLTDEALALLHELAAERKNYSLVAELSKEVYQISPSQKMALNNARAFAAQGQPKPAGGWLQTAWQFNRLDLHALLQEEPFLKVKGDPEFKQFVDPLR